MNRGRDSIGGSPGVPRAVDAYRGGNSNNRSMYGAFALNLNNTASNSDWNIGAAHSYQIRSGSQNANGFPLLLEKMKSMKALQVASRKRERR